MDQSDFHFSVELFKILSGIAIFIFGFFFKVLWDIIADYFKRENLKEDFLFELNIIADSVKIQAEFTKKDSQKLRNLESAGEDVAFTHNPTLFTSLDVFTRSEVRKSFSKGTKEHKEKSKKTIKTVYGCVEAYRYYIEQLIIAINSHTSYYKDLMNRIWNPNIEEIQTCYEKWIGTNNNFSSDEFLIEFDKIVKTWSSLLSTEIYITQIHFISPLLLVSKKYPENEKASELLVYLIKCNNASTQIFSDIIKLSSTFEKRSNDLTELQFVLNRCIDELKK